MKFSVNLVCLSSLVFILLLSSMKAPEEDPMVFFERGLSELKREEYLKAIKEFTHAISLKENFADAYFHRALAKQGLAEKMGYLTNELCFDLVSAMKYKHPKAESLMLKFCSAECHSLKAAKSEPEKVICADLSSSSHASVPADVKTFKNLTSLSLADNSIPVVMWSENMPSFVVLVNISGNKLKSIGKGISKMNHLVDLNANFNFINEVSHSIAQCRKLRILQLSNNFIKDLPDTFTGLQQLEHLDLASNEFTKVPSVLYRMTHLKLLNLSGNKIPASQIEKLKAALPSTEIMF